MKHKGRGVPENDQEAVEWFRKAAEKGDATAQNNLGVMYGTSRGVPEDDREAAKWYRKAADQGFARAQADLGVMYANGEGVVQDYVKAHAWMNLASSQGDKKAAKDRDRLSDRMTREQVAEAQKLAGELFNRIESSKSK